MFRRLDEGLPEDAEQVGSFKDLGFFVTETGHIRNIERPHEDFYYFHTTNERFNEVRCESLHACTRRKVLNRLAKLDVYPIFLPSLSTSKPQSGPYVPILATPPKTLKTKKRVFIVVNDTYQDLGIWSYRSLVREAGLEGGSAISLVRELLQRSVPDSVLHGADGDGTERRGADGQATTNGDGGGFEHGKKDESGPKAKEKVTMLHQDAPGIIILNPGQLLYSPSMHKAMTRASWHGRPRKSAVHPPVLIDQEHNTVPGNRNPSEHVQFVFENIVKNPEFVSSDAELYVVALGGSSEVLTEYLGTEKTGLANERFAAVAFTMTHAAALVDDNHPIAPFLAKRSRIWITSQAPVGYCLNVPKILKPSDPTQEPTIDVKDHATTPVEDVTVSAPTFSAGWQVHSENIFSYTHKHILDWLEAVAVRSFGYNNAHEGLTVQWTIADVEALDKENARQAAEEEARMKESKDCNVDKDKCKEEEPLIAKPGDVFTAAGMVPAGETKPKLLGVKINQQEIDETVKEVMKSEKEVEKVQAPESQPKFKRASATKVKIAGVEVDRDLAAKAGFGRLAGAEGCEGGNGTGEDILDVVEAQMKGLSVNHTTKNGMDGGETELAKSKQKLKVEDVVEAK
ncbi:Arb2 domain-containing protein [Lineolata rhizophorae]|uniref:Arb2 domain-containing protein n=1 Tax=Lineolata rhizophorae TaxID=578093 RepID=A0A6A6P9Q5_9PEZI|nr:Arb2 domain-containing protein [Lineolata rhizophorae]